MEEEYRVISQCREKHAQPGDEAQEEDKAGVEEEYRDISQWRQDGEQAEREKGQRARKEGARAARGRGRRHLVAEEDAEERQARINRQVQVNEIYCSPFDVTILTKIVNW